MSDWRSCENCDNYQCYKRIVERGIETEKPCSDWEPIRCRCGGALSELRTYHYTEGPITDLAKYDGKQYRHCYACHAEFFEEES